MSIKQIFHNLITSNLNISEDDILLKKVRLINFILLLGIPINALFIPINYATDQKLFAFFNILIVTVMIGAFFYLRRSKTHIKLASHATILGMFLIHFPALFQGGIENSGFVWYFLFPLFSIFLLGRNAGRIWIAILFLSIISVFSFSSYLDLPYKPIYLIFLLISLSLETVYVLFSQNIQLRYEAELSSKNKKLELLTHNLKDEVQKQVDITRSKDNLLTQQSKMASVGEMMSNISHQWKQPIGTINVIVQNLQLAYEFEQDNVEELIKDSLEKIINQTDLMQTTMKDFLQFSRPDINKKPFSINHAIHMMQTLVESSFIAHHIELTFKQPNEDLQLNGKENEFVHAIMNITNNAKDVLIERNIKHPEVTIKLLKSEDDITLFISDNAGGIPEDIIPKIFDPYFSTKLDNGGTGLGLHLCSKIINESFEGSLEVMNGQYGACFILNFKA